AHDPDLAAAMHEVLTTAAAIRSTSAILVEDQNLEATWRARFHSNIDADSRRLADSAKALAQYFEVEDDTDLISATPEDELDAFLEAAGDDLGQIAQGAAQIEAVVAASPALRSEAARALGRRYLMTYAADTQAIDPAEFRAALREIGPDPLALAARLAAPPARILRYLARQEALNAGIVVCNRAGQVLFRRRTREFDVPRFGALPSDWLLFEALAQPGLVMAEQHAPTESQGRALQVYATTELTSPASYNKAPDVEATMIVFPVS
ncbi:MAG: transcriptional regulator, partial [Rhodobacteraceae bacterium]|nr:transcriptional regulator [Paracoccaceae bacterium]